MHLVLPIACFLQPLETDAAFSHRLSGGFGSGDIGNLEDVCTGLEQAAYLAAYLRDLLTRIAQRRQPRVALPGVAANRLHVLHALHSIRTLRDEGAALVVHGLLDFGHVADFDDLGLGFRKNHQLNAEVSLRLCVGAQGDRVVALQARSNHHECSPDDRRTRGEVLSTHHACRSEKDAAIVVGVDRRRQLGGSAYFTQRRPERLAVNAQRDVSGVALLPGGLVVGIHGDARRLRQLVDRVERGDVLEFERDTRVGSPARFASISLSAFSAAPRAFSCASTAARASSPRPINSSRAAFRTVSLASASLLINASISLLLIAGRVVAVCAGQRVLATHSTSPNQNAATPGSLGFITVAPFFWK